MIAPHQWPRPIKRLVLTGATALVVLAYASLCVAGWLLSTALLSQVRP